jgi:hypothetical protein
MPCPFNAPPDAADLGLMATLAIAPAFPAYGPSLAKLAIAPALPACWPSMAVKKKAPLVAGATPDGSDEVNPLI